MNTLKPYILRALHEWCTDQGFSPYLSAVIDENVKAPTGYDHDGIITLDISYESTQHLQIENRHISFDARFGGVAHRIVIPVGHVVALYPSESPDEGMFFEPELEDLPDDDPEPPKSDKKKSLFHLVE